MKSSRHCLIQWCRELAACDFEPCARNRACTAIVNYMWLILVPHICVIFCDRLDFVLYLETNHQVHFSGGSIF